MLDIQRADRAVPPFVRKARRQGWGNEDLGDGRLVGTSGLGIKGDKGFSGSPFQYPVAREGRFPKFFAYDLPGSVQRIGT